MKRYFLVTFITALTALSVTAHSETIYSYLDDADKTLPPPLPSDLTMFDQPWPRISMTETKNLKLTDEQFAKYNVVSGKAFVLEKMKRAKGLNPALIYLRHLSARAFQGYDEPLGQQGSGIPFSSTGPATENVTGTTYAPVYAGHWLYQAGTTTTNAIGSSATTATVSNPALVKVGQYVVIYDAPAGSFVNAEHAKVTAVDSATKVITLVRGYRSNQFYHAAGAIVARHVLGAGTGVDSRLWAYNQTSVCPRDANGKTFAEVMTNWISNNYNRDQNGKIVDVVVDGILLDADKYEFPGGGADANNDLVNDNAIISGTDTWSLGMDSLHADLRSKFPEKFIVGGVSDARGFESLSGAQLEEWPTLFRNPLEDNFDSSLANYEVNMHYGQSSIGTHTLVRLPSHTYPTPGSTVPADNKSFRFSFGAALLDNGFYGKENSDKYPDVWYDEYAVDVTPGSPRFGYAIAANDPDIQLYKGWMGYPKGPWKRLYNTTSFAATNSLVSNGTFDVSLTGWSSTNAAINTDISLGNFLEGAAALKVSNIKPGARIKGPAISLLPNTEYTLAFATNASDFRTIRAGLGGSTQELIIPPHWVRHVVKVKTGTAGTYNVNFLVGDETPNVWIDSVYLFKGNANVFTREFGNALVIVNATSASKTIDLGKAYQRIKGTQDPINNGSTLSTITVDPWDAAILVKPAS